MALEPVSSRLAREFVAYDRGPAHHTNKISDDGMLLDQPRQSRSHEPHFSAQTPRAPAPQPILPKPNQPPSTQHLPDPPLHLPKPHEPATLALPMPKQPRQRRELSSTPGLRAPISLQPMHAGIRMLVQRAQGPEAAVVEIALPFVPVPGRVRGAVGRGRGGGVVPADLLGGDEVVRVPLADDLEDAVAVWSAGVRAGGRFEVVEEAGGGGVGRAAEGAAY
ncbi:hypothetical protein LTR35_016178 [Friedmanniomyces endolithicus]|nr:hypothetical protein LTR35_016178 [Friedmanniomyces endolithicus]KAK0297798.1 hypothetical protein LTS00_003336 [Friedmanniomyces endolithicus]KAK0975694.1 hypothetical protein LTR54_016717 [Friedmanniomyces endolithicus]